MRVQSVSEEKAQGAVQAVYQQIHSAFGMVPNVFKVMSLWPEALEKYHDLVKTIMWSPSKLPRAMKEMIAATVSRTNS